MDIFYITWRLLQIGLVFVFHAFRLGRYLIIRALFRRGPTWRVRLGQVIAELFESLGGAFIKIGQILSSRPDLLPPEMISPLVRLQDQVTPFSARKIPELIRESFGSTIGDIFETFDPTPISSASVAQVHLARLKGGARVAVKIRRPRLVMSVRNDLLILNLLVRMAQLFPAMRLVPLKGIVKEFGQVIEQQLDFTLEADNNRIFRQNFAHCQQIVIPRLYDNLCGEAILTMEYLDGLIKVGHLDLTTQEREAAAITSLRALYQMIFIDGFTHGDMHPGNIFFRRNGEFVMLDLGLVARLSGSDLIDFASFFFGMVTNNGQECARVVYETATFRAPYCDRKKFETAMVELVDRHTSKGARDFEVSEFALQLFNTQRRHGICGSTNFMMTILSLVVFEGIAKQIHPNLDFQGEARRFIPAIMSRQRFGRY